MATDFGTHNLGIFKHSPCHLQWVRTNILYKDYQLELQLSSPEQFSQLLLHEGQGMLLQVQLLSAEVSKKSTK